MTAAKPVTADAPRAYDAKVARQPASGDDVGPLAVREAAQTPLRVSTDALLDPLVLFEAVQDDSGQIVDFVYRELNQATCDYLGRSRDELLGRRVSETSPGIRDTLLPGYIRCVETGEPLILDGFTYDSELLLDTRVYDLRATRATPTFITVTWRDVTDRYRMEQRVAAAEEKFRQSMEHAAIGMCLIAPDGRFEEVNEALCELFGYDAETLTKKTWQQLTAPEFLEADLANVKDVLEGRIDSYRMLKQYIHADGHPIWGDLAVSCVRDERGAVVNFISQITDVTAQVKTEARNRDLARALQRQHDLIAASEQHYRLLIENAADVVCHIRDDTFVWISPNAEDVLGAPAEHWLGRGVSEVIPPEDAQDHADRWKKLSEGESFKGRVRINAVNGVTHWVSLHAKPFYDDDGVQDGVRAALRLIDDEVAAEHELEEARRQQARADARYRRTMENAAVAMCLVTPEGRFTEVNDAACRFFHLDAETLKQMSFQDLTAPEYMDAELKNFTDILEGRTDAYRMVKHFARSDGHTIWGDLTVSCIRDESGRVTEIIGQILDVTAEVEARRQIAAQNERNHALARQLQQQNEQIAASERDYRLLADNAVDVIIHFAGDEVVWVSPSIEAALGFTAAQFIGSDLTACIHPDDLDTVTTSLRAIAPGESLLKRFRIRSADGDYHWVDSHTKPYMDAEGNVDGLILALRTVDEQVAAEQRLDRLARFDTLTGLVNRAETFVRLESALACARTSGSELGVLFCDIDRFKAINDTLGHNVGDTVMQTVADRISRCVRHGDTVGRTGGDEMLVLLPGLHNLEQALDMAEKIRALTAEPIRDHGSTFHATLSVGATLAIPGESVTDLIARADTAMYQAKSAGGNTVSGICAGSD